MKSQITDAISENLTDSDLESRKNFYPFHYIIFQNCFQNNSRRQKFNSKFREILSILISLNSKSAEKISNRINPKINFFSKCTDGFGLKYWFEIAGNGRDWFGKIPEQLKSNQSKHPPSNILIDLNPEF